jgi:hypothetical protein
MGKTQLSIRFIKQSGSQHWSVFWLNAKDESILKAGLAALAIEMADTSTSLTVTDAHEEERLVQQARQWLSKQGNNKWLMVYDNYDGPWLPGDGQLDRLRYPHVLPTTSTGLDLDHDTVTAAPLYQAASVKEAGED